MEVKQLIAQLADLADQSRVVLQDVANGIERMPCGGVELGLLDEMGRDVEGDISSHNRPYVTRRPVPEGLSGRRST